MGAPGSEGDGWRWLLNVTGGKKIEPGVGSRIQIQNFAAGLSGSSGPASLGLQDSLTVPLSSSLAVFNLLGLKQFWLNWPGQLTQDTLPQDVKKSQMLDHLAEIEEKSPCCQALGTSGSRLDSHFAFPTKEECMKSHQALMMLLCPRLGEGQRAPANSEALERHWPSCLPEGCTLKYKAASRLTYSFFCLLH